jgi:hypothetical protein
MPNSLSAARTVADANRQAEVSLAAMGLDLAGL